MTEEIKLTEDDFFTYDNDDSCDTISCKEKFKQRILDDHEKAGKVDNMYIRVGQLIQEIKQLKETYLNETCGYCKEKMIIIGSRHIHACKHDLINVDKDKIMDENKQLKEELNQLLNDPDFGHMKNCGICGELVSKAIDETSAINVKGSRLTWVCNDCDNLKQKLEEIKEVNDSHGEGSTLNERIEEILDSQEKK